jgi:site-specific recombinase XerD
MRRLRRLNHAITIWMILQTGYTFADVRQALHQYRISLYDSLENGIYVDDVTSILLEYLSDVSKQVAAVLSSWTSCWGEISCDRQSLARTSPALVTRYYLASNLQALFKIRPARLTLSLLYLKRYYAWAIDFGLFRRGAGRAWKQLAEERRRYFESDVREEDLEPYYREDLLADLDLPPWFLRERLLLRLLLFEGLTAKEICLIRPIDVECDGRGCILQVRKTTWRQRTRLDRGTQWTLEAYLDDLDPRVQFLIPAHYSWEMSGQALRNELNRYLVHTRPPWVGEHRHRYWFGCHLVEHALAHRMAAILGCSSIETAMVYVWKALWELIEEVIKRFEPDVKESRLT